MTSFCYSYFVWFAFAFQALYAVQYAEISSYIFLGKKFPTQSLSISSINAKTNDVLGEVAFFEFLHTYHSCYLRYSVQRNLVSNIEFEFSSTTTT